MKKISLILFFLIVAIIIGAGLVYRLSFKQQIVLSDSKIFYQKYGWGDWSYEEVVEEKVSVNRVTLLKPRDYSGVAVELSSRFDLMDSFQDAKVVFYIKLLEPKTNFYFGLTDFVLDTHKNEYTLSTTKLSLKKFLDANDTNWQKVEIPISDFPAVGEYWVAGSLKRIKVSFAHLFAYRFQIASSTADFLIKDIYVTSKKPVKDFSFTRYLADYEVLKDKIKINQLGYHYEDKKYASIHQAIKHHLYDHCSF